MVDKHSVIAAASKQQPRTSNCDQKLRRVISWNGWKYPETSNRDYAGNWHEQIRKYVILHVAWPPQASSTLQGLKMIYRFDQWGNNLAFLMTCDAAAIAFRTSPWWTFPSPPPGISWKEPALMAASMLRIGSPFSCKCPSLSIICLIMAWCNWNHWAKQCGRTEYCCQNFLAY